MKTIMLALGHVGAGALVPLLAVVLIIALIVAALDRKGEDK